MTSLDESSYRDWKSAVGNACCVVVGVSAGSWLVIDGLTTNSNGGFALAGTGVLSIVFGVGRGWLGVHGWHLFADGRLELQTLVHQHVGRASDVAGPATDDAVNPSGLPRLRGLQYRELKLEGGQMIWASYRLHLRGRKLKLRLSESAGDALWLALLPK